MDSVIYLNKPVGMTSFDAVAKLRKILHERKIGHTGTLDPNASGVLIILTGRYTKLLPFCVKDHKQYRATFRFGTKTDTQDIWGETVAEKKPEPHTLEEIQAVANTFVGDIQQIPPMYSAIKVNGQKLYELARKGIEIERAPRDAHIDYMRIREVGDNEYEMETSVSSGTYVRTLITDLCERLNEYGCMTSLVRTGIESITLDDCSTFEQLEQEVPSISPLRVIHPEYDIQETNAIADISNGRNIELNSDRDMVILTKDGSILAAYKRVSGKLFHCERGLC